MTNTKHIVSGGIAFSERKDLKQLKKFAAEGWLVKRYKGMGYELEQGEPEEVDYSIDIHHLARDEEDEYFSMFEFAGWAHVCSSYDTHLFKAPVGTKPIYSDSKTKAEKLLRLQKSITPAIWMGAILTIISYLLLLLMDGGIVFWVLFVIFLAFTIPSVLMYITLTIRRLRLK
jgi:hypothetical protein